MCETVGCYNCGKINGEYSKDEETGLYLCGECGKLTVVSMNELLYIASNYMQSKRVSVYEILELLELHEEYEEDF